MKFCHEGVAQHGPSSPSQNSEMPHELSRGVVQDKREVLTLVVLPQDSINTNSQKGNVRVSGGDTRGQNLSAGHFEVKAGTSGSPSATIVCGLREPLQEITAHPVLRACPTIRCLLAGQGLPWVEPSYALVRLLWFIELISRK